MAEKINAAPKPTSGTWTTALANVCLMLLIGCCLCASLAANLL